MEKETNLDERLACLETAICNVQTSIKNLTEMGVFFNQKSYSELLKRSISEVLRDNEKAGKLSEIAWLSRIAIMLLVIFFSVGVALLIWLAS
jgi:uncharacterized membrane protein